MHVGAVECYTPLEVDLFGNNISDDDDDDYNSFTFYCWEVRIIFSY